MDIHVHSCIGAIHLRSCSNLRGGCYYPISGDPLCSLLMFTACVMMERCLHHIITGGQPCRKGKRQKFPSQNYILSAFEMDPIKSML